MSVPNALREIFPTVSRTRAHPPLGHNRLDSRSRTIGGFSGPAEAAGWGPWRLKSLIAPRKLHRPALRRQANELHVAGDIEFLTDRRMHVRDRLRTQTQHRGNGFVTLATGDEPENVELPNGEPQGRLGRFGPSHLTDSLRDIRTHRQHPRYDAAHRADHQRWITTLGDISAGPSAGRLNGKTCVIVHAEYQHWY